MKPLSTKKDIKKLGAVAQALWIFVVSASRAVITPKNKIDIHPIILTSAEVRCVLEDVLEEIDE